MIHRLYLLSFAILITWIPACAAPPIPHEPDRVDVTLHASADLVTTAVVQILTEGGYSVDRTDDQNLTIGYRQEISGPWDWLLRWRLGTSRSRVEVMVTPTSESSSRLRMNVLYEGKDGLFTQWEDSPTAQPQSAQNQLRLIKNALQLL